MFTLFKLATAAKTNEIYTARVAHTILALRNMLLDGIVSVIVIVSEMLKGDNNLYHSEFH